MKNNKEELPKHQEVDLSQSLFQWETNLVGTESKPFHIVLNKNFHSGSDILVKYKVGCDPYEIYEPRKTILNKIRRFFGMKQKEESVGWEYTIKEIEEDGTIDQIKDEKTQ